MIGRLQTERDKARLLEGMSSAAGSVDVSAVDATISGLGKREFMLRRAGRDHPEIFTTRWAMSYLRGPMTRDQIATLTPSVADAPVTPTSSGPASSGLPSAAAGAAPAPSDSTTAHDATTVMPKVADGVTARYVDVAAPWLGDVGGDSQGAVLEAAIVARVAIRYDETTADLVHDEEYEAVLFPLGDQVNVSQVVQVDYDDRDLRSEAPAGATYRLTEAKIATKSFFTQVEGDLRDHLTRSVTLEIPANPDLKLYGRPGESAEEFVVRCATFADERANDDIAKLRDKYEAKATRLRDQIDAAEDRADVAEEEANAKSNSELFSTAGSVLGGLLGGRKSKGGMIGDILGDAGQAARRRGSTSASDRRVDAAENKVARLTEQLAELEAEAKSDVTEIAERWDSKAATISTKRISAERTDIQVVQLALAWLPVG